MTLRASAPDVMPFDVCGALPPTGMTVLEASAGTGKTFTIAALAARYVADGVPLDSLLLVTFTRMATGELRDRVRGRLLSAERGLARAGSGEPPDPDDDVLRLLADGSPAKVELRRRRLGQALAHFDAATIATTHQFSQQMLASLGTAGDVDRDAAFSPDARDLVEEVVDDLYVRRFWRDSAPPSITRDQALDIGWLAVTNPDALLVPHGASQDSDPAMRVRLAAAVRRELERRKRRSGIITYDDLLTRLADTLAQPGQRGDEACARLRQRYRIALVDEFHDTDPTQWEILRRIFTGGPSTLVLIGDPKQAIYSFRGADVYAYLDAARQADRRQTLTLNWRADQGLVAAYDALFRGARLGHVGITYHRVRAADAHQISRLAGAPVGAPLRIRVVHRDDGSVALTRKGYAGLSSAREHVARDLAADLVRLLSSRAEILTRATDGTERSRSPVGPADVAVLVGRHRDAATVRDALAAAGIPAVINGAGSVFATPAAREWLRVLEALERPTSPGRARAVALTDFLGWSAQRVATAPDSDWEAVHGRLHRWADTLRHRGVAALSEAISSSEGLPRRVLSRPDGERVLTDLRHVGELLHATATGERLGLTALAAWLRERIREAASDTDAEERSRRLESDAEAVQVLTIHRSKGLEFPVVYCPYLWQASWIPEDQPPIYHDARGRRVLDLGGGSAHEVDPYMAEQRGEDLRLAYVALTRAASQAVVWWAGSWDSRHSPLSRLLFSRGDDGTIAALGHGVPEDAEALQRFEQLAADAPGCVSVERSGASTTQSWRPQPRPAADLAAARFERQLDRSWRRNSYSRITSGSHDSQVGSETDAVVVNDEAMSGAVASTAPAAAGTAAAATAAAAEASLRAHRLPLADMPGGAAVGTAVHDVLEGVDFAAADAGDQLAAAVAQVRRHRAVDVGNTATLVAGLQAVLETPLGPLLGDARLRDVGRFDRVDELAFELPLVGGNQPTATLTVARIAATLRTHLPAGDVLADYPARLDNDSTLHRELRGYLAGSLDLVLRQLETDGTQRFAVVDYKTNHLGGEGERLTAWHYRPEALTAGMQRSHYPLQALLYVVALHRYLRWRLPGYAPDRNLAGVLYLFVRGMSGAEVPRVNGQPCGVFAWRPPASLVTALSDLFDTGSAAA